MQVANIDTQAFLAEELAHLEKLRQSDESSSNQRAAQKGSATLVESSSESTAVAEGRVSEHIGPVQFNMGGIQVDADDMLQRLKVSWNLLDLSCCAAAFRQSMLTASFVGSTK